MRRYKPMLVLVLLIQSLLLGHAGSALASPVGQTGPSVTPPSITLDLEQGGTHLETITVRSASTPIPRVDVMFLFDVTGSMRGLLDQAKASGTAIMNGLRAQVPDSTFAVASFFDFPGRFSSPATTRG